MIANNIQLLKQKIPSNVELVAVSKFHPSESILEAYEVGQRVFGESKLQELKPKVESLPKDIIWHFIGHLQKNKVKETISLVDTIQSVDSISLLKEIQKQSSNLQVSIKCFLQVYLGHEDSKYGFSLSACREIFESGLYSNSDYCKITGIMCMATNTDDESLVKEEFKQVSQFFNELKRDFGSTNKEFVSLSMGMSHDFELAIEEGSNIIRVGSLIFGDRVY